MSQTYEIVTTKAITTSGNSYVVNVTKELKALGLGPGDLVEITVRRIA